MFSNGYSINANVASALSARTGGLPGGGAKVITRPYKYWHRLNVPKAGSETFRFFNEARANGVTNLEQANTLPSNYAFALHCIRLSFLPGFDREGKRLGIAPASITAAERRASALNWGKYEAAVPTDTIDRVPRWHEKMRELMEQAEVELHIGDRPIQNVYGLTNYPQGRGLVGGGALATGFAQAAPANAYQGDAISTVSNGVPIVANAWGFGVPFPLVGGQQFSLVVRYNRAVDFTEADLGPLEGVTNAVTAGVLMCELEGELITPGA